MIEVGSNERRAVSEEKGSMGSTETTQAVDEQEHQTTHEKVCGECPRRERRGGTTNKNKARITTKGTNTREKHDEQRQWRSNYIWGGGEREWLRSEEGGRNGEHGEKEREHTPPVALCRNTEILNQK